MSTDEPTKDLTEERTEPLATEKAGTTQPMLKEILERVNEGFAQMNTRFTTLEVEMRDVKKALHALERRFDVFTIELNKSKADVWELENRLEELERKAS